MDKLFQVATNISTPLMLAGFLSCAFFLILKEILKKNIFPKLTQQLSGDIIKLIINRFFKLSLVALILGFVGFLINNIQSTSAKKGPDIKIVSNTSVTNNDGNGSNIGQSSDKFKVGLDDNYAKDSKKSFGNPNDFIKKIKNNTKDHEYIVKSTIVKKTNLGFAGIEYKLKNVGDEVAIITKVVLEVLKSELNLTPNLIFELRPDKQGNLKIIILNEGWGPALDAEINYLSGPVRSVLSGADDEYKWHGSINDTLEINIPARKISTKKKTTFCCNEIKGFVKYSDLKGNKYEEKIKYKLVGDYIHYDEYNNKTKIKCRDVLIVNPKYFNIISYETGPVCAALLPLSARYKGFLEPLDRPYNIEVDVSNVVEPNKADRFFIEINSTKSAKYYIRSHIIVDDNVIITTKQQVIDVMIGKSGTTKGKLIIDSIE